MDTPFRILVLGDFGARAGAARPIAVDRDDFEAVMAKLDVGATLAAGESGAPVELAFRELDDFHPDRLFERAPLFGELAKLRRRLSNPDTFAAAAAEMSGFAAVEERPSEPAEPAPAPEPKPEAAAASSDDLLGALVAETERREDEREAGAGVIDALVREVVAPYVVPAPDPRQADLVAAVDAASGKSMRTLLRHPRFRALETAWRGLWFAVRRLETSSRLSVHVFDRTKESLSEELTACDDVAASSLAKELVDGTVGTPGAQPWTLIVGAFELDESEADARLCAALARIAAAAGATFVSSATSSLGGCRSFGDAPDPDDWSAPEPAGEWAELRARPEAERAALALPRFLLRAPYGARSGPIERFAFEELEDASDHEAFCWGNPSFALATSLGQSFAEAGWDLRPGMHPELDRIPLHVAPDADEATPGAELFLTERGAEKLAARGLIAVHSLKGRDAIRIGRFRALSGAELAGRWS